jgi:hypothetical protein
MGHTAPTAWELGFYLRYAGQLSIVSCQLFLICLIPHPLVSGLKNIFLKSFLGGISPQQREMLDLGRPQDPTGDAQERRYRFGNSSCAAVGEPQGRTASPHWLDFSLYY